MKSFLVGNWKMHFSPAQSTDLAVQMAEIIPQDSPVEVWIAPPALSVLPCSNATKATALRIGAQNAHWEDSGACTGELSVPMLKESGASFCITGHSERRHIFGESNKLVCQRTLGILKKDFTVIHCIGETLEQRENGEMQSVLQEQVQPIFDECGHSKNLIVAYEPVWAIGTGKVATTKEISEAHSFIQSLWNGLGDCPPILYGGSVKPSNYAQIIAIPSVAGALVGGASLKKESFEELLSIASAA